MKTKQIRTIVAVAVFVVLAGGLILGTGFGTLSGFGWDTITAICPLGAITTMIASRTFVPRALISVVIMALLVLVVGRAFCGWACPVPLLERIKNFLRPAKQRKAIAQKKNDDMMEIAKSELGCSGSCSSCSTCAQEHHKFDSRHYVLAGTLLSTAIFGFPVFCMICPIGLTFASVLVIWRLFSAGDMTWSVILIPLLLIVELAFLRKWCTRFCPMAGLMNLVSRFNRTFRPVIDDSKCLETSKGAPCSRCAIACDADINIRHIEFGERTLDDCTRCRSCVDACPTQAIKMPLLAKKAKTKTSPASPPATSE